MMFCLNDMNTVSSQLGTKLDTGKKEILNNRGAKIIGVLIILWA